MFVTVIKLGAKIKNQPLQIELPPYFYRYVHKMLVIFDNNPFQAYLALKQIINE